MKLSTYILTFVILISCSATHNGLRHDNELIREQIVFKKRQIGHRATYSIDRPNIEGNNKTTILMLGGHGHGFQIIYSDSSTIYYSNDHAISTPNHDNYETIGWKTLSFHTRINDTVLTGQQVNSRFWKEIIKGEDYIGYLNVSRENKELFDKALMTFKK